MRYIDTSDPLSKVTEPLYRDASDLQFVLAFTVVIALMVGIALLWLGRHGRILWLQVWSVGLILASFAYLIADMLGYSGFHT